MMRRTLAYMVLLLGLLVPAQAQTIPMDSVRGGICGMLDPDTKQQAAISPVFTRVNVIVTDAMAQAVVTQTFVNPFKAKTEAIYVFPLPDQGSVHGMQYVYHESLYVAEIMDKVRAQQVYDSIRNQGGQAALLLQERPNIFTQRLATLGAGDTARVEISLSFPLKYADGEFELSFPTMIAPRYPNPGAPGSWNPPTTRPGPEFQFNVLIRSGVELLAMLSPTHPIDGGDLNAMGKILTERGLHAPSAGYAFAGGVVLKDQSTYPNSDFVLRMKRVKTTVDFSLATSRAGAGSGYFMLNLFPDASQFAGKRPDLELILLVDVSGSQTGWPLEREKEITLNILSRLTDKDDLALLAFHDQVLYAFGNEVPVPANRDNIAKGETFVRGLVPLGSTQLLAAVNASLAVPARSEKKRIFIFLTDGFITNETAVLAAIANHPSRPTVFTFGAGNNLNRYFLEESAKVGNGFATALVQNDPVAPAVEAAWSRIESPQIDHLKIEFGGMLVSDMLQPFSDRLYRGLPYRVLGKYGQGGTYTVTLSGFRAGAPWTQARQIVFADADASAWSVPKLWAREKIGRLMLEQGTTESNKAAIIAVSVEHQVLSAYTAFLAKDPRPVGNGNPSGPIGVEVRQRSVTPFAFTVENRRDMLVLEWKGGSPVQAIEIHDLKGRLVFTYRPGRNASEITRWIWDGRDARGRRLDKGLYVASVRTRAGLKSRVFAWNLGR